MTETKANDALLHAFSCMQGGDPEQAVDLCTRLIERYPCYAEAIHLRAVALRRSGQLAAAIRGFIQALMIDSEIHGARINFDSALSDALFSCLNAESGHQDLLDACFDAVILSVSQKAVVPDGKIFFLLTHVLTMRSCGREARQVTRAAFAALGPDSSYPFHCQASLLDYGNPDDGLIRLAAGAAVKRLRRHPDAVEAMDALLFYAYYTDRPRVLARLIDRLMKRVSLTRIGKEPLLRPWYLSRVSPAFLASRVVPRNDAVVFRELQAAQTPLPAVVLLLSCDDAYWTRFSSAFARTLAEQADGGFALHINIVDPTDATCREVAQLAAGNSSIGYSFLAIADQGDLPGRLQRYGPGAAISFYACSRFLIVPELMTLYGASVLALDTDMALKRPIRDFLDAYAAVATGDFAVNGGVRLGPGREFFCNITGFAMTPSGRALARLLKKYMLHFLYEEVPFWMIDQAAMYAVLTALRQIGMEPLVTLLEREGLDSADYFIHATGTRVDKAAVLAKVAAGG